MKKYQILSALHKEKIIGVIRINNPNAAEKSFEALLKGGIKSVELTFTVPFAHSILERVKRAFNNSLYIGAGTILDSESARIAILSGADYLLTPSLNTEVIKTGNRYGIPVISGIASATEAVHAIEMGCDVVKIFPANQFNYDVISSLKGPLPNLEVIPTGGIDLGNLVDWLKAGAFAVGVGGELTYGAANGDFKLVTETAKKFCEVALR